jgi:integrase/recombinase XerD
MRHSLGFDTHTTLKFKSMNHFTAKVICRKELTNKQGVAPLALKAHINGEKTVIALSVMVQPALWNPDKQQLKSNAANANQINQIAAEALSRTLTIVANANMSNTKLTRHIFTNLYKQASTSGNFIEYAFEKLNQRKGNKIELTSAKAQKAVLNKLKNFRKEIPFAEINIQLLEAFEKHLKTKLKNKPNTIHGAFRVMKTYVRLALQDGYVFENPFLRYKLKKAQTHRTFLTKEEVEKLLQLYHKATLPPMQQTSLQYFLISCFTSLRISDVRHLTTDHINNNQLTLIPHKTKGHNKQVVIPITTTARQLLIAALSEKQHLACEQRINRHLKAIAIAANIKKRITFHVSRHTFATVFLDLGGKVETLQQLLGHSDITTTMVYAHITDKRKQEEMQNFDKYFN